jgi:RNA polymerase sigma-70 factor (ECF subfamily)
VGTSLQGALELVVLSSAPRDRANPTPAPAPASQLDACRRGDRNALDAVFRAHAESLARLLTRIVGPSVELEDLLQDTFAAAIPAFHTFRGEASIKTWLSRIAIHVAHQHLRKPRHRREVALVEPESVGGAPTQTPEQRELARRLYTHLDTIDAPKRIALVLYAIEGHTVDEISVLMGASKTATRSRIFWARRALLKHLRKDAAFARDGGTS